MSTDPEIHALWQDQPTEAQPMDIEKIRKKAGEFQTTIRNRNIREYVVGAMVACFFARDFLAATRPLPRLAFAMLVLGTVYACWQLHRRGSAETCPPSETPPLFIRFHRDQLLRQRAALRRVWAWYIAPFIPGMIVLFLARAQQGRAQTAAAGVAVVAILCVIVWYVNRLAADGMDRQLSEVERALRDYE
jgi:Flp pilus assembly protein TadB